MIPSQPGAYPVSSDYKLRTLAYSDGALKAGHDKNVSYETQV
jgi:hypothetical protein